MSFLKRRFWLVLMLITASPVIAQEQPATEEHPAEADVLSATWANGVATLLPYHSGMFAAEDGQYLAQTAEELQTYYDLAMSYEYIESSRIRTLLQLDENEGIIIDNVQQDGEGFRVGFRPGDLVLRVADTPVVTQYDLVTALTEHRGDSVAAIVLREGQQQALDFALSQVFVETQKRWILGVTVDEMSELLQSHLGFNGAVITEITEDGPAEKMGLRIHDVIVKIDDAEIGNIEELRSAMQESDGDTVTVEVVRAGNQMTVEVTPQQVQDDIATRFDSFYDVPLLRYHFTPHVRFEPATRQYMWDLTRTVEAAESVEPTEEEPQAVELDRILTKLDDLQQQIQELRDVIGK